MFKKRTTGTKKKGFRKAKAPDDDSDEEAEEAQASSTLEQIQQAKKKRKLLTDAQYKRGVGADELLQQSADTGKKRQDAVGDDVPVDGSSSSNKDNNNVATSRDGILEQKHSEAMAKYIEQQMGEAKAAAIGSKIEGQEEEESSTTQDHEKSKKAVVLLTKDALYAELAVTSQRLAGKMNNNNTGDHADNASSSATISTDDLGSGGAVLVAGTGIAEVILPVEERLQVARETEKAQQQHQQNRLARKSSSAAAAAGAVAPRPQGLPNRFFIPSRSLPQMSHHANSSSSADAARANAAAGTNTEEPAMMAAVDDDRLGFEALKRQKDGPSGKKTTSTPLHHRDRANDLRVFRNFVSRERDKKK